MGVWLSVYLLFDFYFQEKVRVSGKAYCYCLTFTFRRK